MQQVSTRVISHVSTPDRLQHCRYILQSSVHISGLRQEFRYICTIEIYTNETQVLNILRVEADIPSKRRQVLPFDVVQFPRNNWAFNSRTVKTLNIDLMSIYKTCHNVMAHSEVGGCRNGPPKWRVDANILNKQSLTADKGWSSSLGVGRAANKSPIVRTCHCTNHSQMNRTWFVDWLLWTRQWTFGFDKMRGISWLTKNLLDFQRQRSSVGSVGLKNLSFQT